MATKATMTNNNFQERANFIWSIAEILRGDYKQSDYGKVVLPLVVLRRLDCVLAPTKDKVLEELAKIQQMGLKNLDQYLFRITDQNFYNTSRYDFKKLIDDSEGVAANLQNYINGFSKDVREIMEKFEFHHQITKLDDANLLYQVLKKFSEIELGTDKVNSIEMGYIFEELIRRFSEQSNETAGEHFTPREVIRLMVNILFIEDRDILTGGVIKTLYDPACGTGGMLSIAEEYLQNELNDKAKLVVFGQEINPESYAICKSEMLLKGQDPENIKFGNSFTNDELASKEFNYMLSNPPFGVEWKKYEKEIKNESTKLGFGGRFGAGLPRVSDGSLLFLQHMISKMKQNGEEGTRLAIVFNGSPLFSGQAGSGESDIRKWIIENDLLEAIIAMPDQLFYNTGIYTYIWVVTNRKNLQRKGKIQLINAVDYFAKMRKSLGQKRKFITEEQISDITTIYGNYDQNKSENSKIFLNEDFGFYRITVERPLRLNFQVTQDRIDTINYVKAIEPHKNEIIKTLQKMDSSKLYKNREEFIKELKKAFKNTTVSYNANLQKALISGLSEKDETADICCDAKGKPEPDADLRDYENVPIIKNKDEEITINIYFEKEVKPHVPDAWVDYEKTKIGYEIPVTRHFYKYTPPRPLEEIDCEIKVLEKEIMELLSDVTACNI